MKKLACVVLLSMICLAATYESQVTQVSWKFDNPAIVEQQMNSISGKWEVITPPQFNTNMLTQSVKYADFPKVLMKERDFFDFQASTRIYVSSENENVQAGGLILRYRNLYSFYMLFLNTKDKRVTLTRAARGGLKVLQRTEGPFTPDRWYELKATCYLDQIRVYIDNQLLIEVKDKTSTGGKVGLVTASTSKVFFDDLKVQAESISVGNPS